MSKADELTSKITSLVGIGKVTITTRHIEVDRAYREIRAVDVRAVLESGKVTSYALNSRIEWTGKDDDKRTIKLLCRLKDKSGSDTLEVVDAELVVVGAAYEPKKDDSQLRSDWLKENPDWKEKAGTDGHVEKK